MFNFTDTETSDPRFQRIIQLAAVLCDEQGNELEVLNTLIKPDGWEIVPRFVDIHGITTEMCERDGMPMPVALLKYSNMLKQTKKVVCHNYDFDSKRLMAEMLVYGMGDLFAVFAGTPSFCTMKELTNVCCLPNPSGRSGYKWPKLKEAHKHFFGVEFADQHDALSDNRACARIYFHMHKPATPVKVIESAPAQVAESEFGSAAPL